MAFDDDQVNRTTEWSRFAVAGTPARNGLPSIVSVEKLRRECFDVIF
jgi:hypothetical protein